VLGLVCLVNRQKGYNLDYIFTLVIAMEASFFKSSEPCLEIPLVVSVSSRLCPEYYQGTEQQS
jgi:hypothetical protein